MNPTLTQRVCVRGVPILSVQALPAHLPNWPEIPVVLCRPHAIVLSEMIEQKDSWNVIHTASGLKVNAGYISKTRTQAIADAEAALEVIAQTRGRDAVLRFVELETKTSPLNAQIS